MGKIVFQKKSFSQVPTDCSTSWSATVDLFFKLEHGSERLIVIIVINRTNLFIFREIKTNSFQCHSGVEEREISYGQMVSCDVARIKAS